MNLAGYFQKIKWQFLAKKNPNYYIFSDEAISKNEADYRKSGQDDVHNIITGDSVLAEILRNNGSKICLEMGCGNGRMTEFLAKEFARVFAVDISQEMLDLAQKRLAGYSNVDFIQSDGTKFNLPNESIDFVFSYLVLQHFLTKEMVKKTLKEFYRLLKIGGTAKIQARGRQAFGGILRYFKWYYGVCFSKEEISVMLREIGFRIIKLEGEGTKVFWLLITKE